MISSIGASTNCDPSASGRGTPGRGGAIAAVTCQYGGGSARPRRIALNPTCPYVTFLAIRHLLGSVDNGFVNCGPDRVNNAYGPAVVAPK